MKQKIRSDEIGHNEMRNGMGAQRARGEESKTA